MTVTSNLISVRRRVLKLAATMWLVMSDQSTGCFPAVATTGLSFSCTTSLSVCQQWAIVHICFMTDQVVSWMLLPHVVFLYLPHVKKWSLLKSNFSPQKKVGADTVGKRPIWSLAQRAVSKVLLSISLSSYSSSWPPVGGIWVDL